jgi:hypothetical protein
MFEDDSARFAKSSKCPKCGEHLFRVAESRNVNGIKRRRRICGDKDCNHRETTYEISSADYQFLNKARAVERIFSGAKNAKSSSQVTCDSCVQWKNGGCDFDFPEAGGRFAEECSLYDRR